MVVSERYLDSLVRKVNHLISQGWKPKGGIAFSTENYLQALTK